MSFLQGVHTASAGFERVAQSLQRPEPEFVPQANNISSSSSVDFSLAMMGDRDAAFEQLKAQREESGRLDRLEIMLVDVVQRTNRRLERIENGISNLTDLIMAAAANGGLAVGGGGASVLASPTAPNSAPFPPAAGPAFGVTPQLRVANIETRWFTKRPYPAFVVHVLNPDGSPFVDTQNWQVAIRLVSGHGMFVDHFLNAPSLVFPVTDGKATITGVKFTAVTSRNGGYFQFEVAVTHPTNSNITPVRSPEFRVLSERLKNENKAGSIRDLSAGSPLVQVPGIGKKYAQRFAEAGLTTVRDLAALDASPASSAQRKSLLDTVRKDRGSLTEGRLWELLREAQEVVKRVDVVDSSPFLKRGREPSAHAHPDADGDEFAEELHPDLVFGGEPAAKRPRFDPPSPLSLPPTDLDLVVNVHAMSAAN